MGQAEQDLPAAMNASADGAAPGADDLLAQLAGEDIDKMLAEADAESGSAPAGAAPVDSAVSDPGKGSPEELAKELDELLKQSEQKESPSAAATAFEPPASEPSAPDIESSPAQPSSPAITADLVESNESPPAAPSSSDPAPPPDVAITSKADDTTADPPRESVTAAFDAEPSVAVLPTPTPVSTEKKEPTPAPTAATAAVNDGGDCDPWYVRILEFLNSPLDSFPDSIRDAVGKIALLTLLNAVAIIGYVMLIRRK